ncbi:hypothetical protein FRC12_018760 [Ceratobasidium sp. 428]|nr:hypothetical protein FRC12_018760 [Ceratobasidium sp. 428]
MYTLNPRHSITLTRKQIEQCHTYREAFSDYRHGLVDHPGVEPQVYQLYRAMMPAGPDHPGHSPSPNQRCTQFTATEDGNIVDIATQALQALMETQEDLRSVLRSAGANRTSPTGSTRSPTIQANIPLIPDGFTGQILTTLASRIGMDNEVLVEITQRINGLYLQERRLLRSALLGLALQEQFRSKRGKGTGRGGKKLSSTTTLQTAPIAHAGADAGPEPIEINEPGVSLSLGPTGLDAGSSAHAAPPGTLNADPSLESEEDGWNIPDYDEESW